METSETLEGAGGTSGRSSGGGHKTVQPEWEPAHVLFVVRLNSRLNGFPRKRGLGGPSIGLDGDASHESVTDDNRSWLSGHRCGRRRSRGFRVPSRLTLTRARHERAW